MHGRKCLAIEKYAGRMDGIFEKPAGTFEIADLAAGRPSGAFEVAKMSVGRRFH